MQHAGVEDPPKKKKKEFKNPYANPWTHTDDVHETTNPEEYEADVPAGYPILKKAKKIAPSHLAEGSRYGPLDPPFFPWNDNNHYVSDEKTWVAGAPVGYVHEPAGPNPNATPSLM